MSARTTPAYDTALSRLATTNNSKTARLPVDSKQKSFEENLQFRFHVFLSDLWGADFPVIPATNGYQVAFKFSATIPVNIIFRNIQTKVGSVVYRVFADDENVTFTGTLEDVSESIFNVNNNLEDSGLSTHPDSGVTVEHARGVNIFRSTSKSPNGTTVADEGNQSFWLVLDQTSNQESEIMFTVVFERRPD